MRIKRSSIRALLKQHVLLERTISLKDLRKELRIKNVKEIQRIIGTKDDGDWGKNTDKAWFAWCRKDKTQEKAWEYFSKNAKNVKSSEEKTVKDAVKSGNVKKIVSLFKRVNPKGSQLALVNLFATGTNKTKVSVKKSSAEDDNVIDLGTTTIIAKKPGKDKSAKGKGEGEGEELKKKASVERGSGKILYMGDSQMAGGQLGKVLINKFGNKQAKVAEGSKQAIHFVGRSSKGDMTGNSTKELKKKPEAIIISLNGNGILGTEKFLEKIKKLSPESKLVWLGAPPITKQWKKKDGKIIPFPKKYGWSKYTQNPIDFKRIQKKRKSRNTKVKDIIQGFVRRNSDLQWTFIDPFDFLDDNTVSIKAYDGVHLSRDRAQKYVDAASGDIQKAISSTMTEAKNIKITLRQLRRLLKESVNSDFKTDGRVLVSGDKKYKITSKGFNLPLKKIEKKENGYEVTIKKPFVAGGGLQTGMIEGKDLMTIESNIANDVKRFSIDMLDPVENEVNTITFKKVY